jgi:hypothetical protein
MAVKKVYSKQQRYNMAMKKLGFQHRRYWVHDDDHEAVRLFVAALREKRQRSKTTE